MRKTVKISKSHKRTTSQKKSKKTVNRARQKFPSKKDLKLIAWARRVSPYAAYMMDM